jgi:hypothetical protein
MAREGLSIIVSTLMVVLFFSGCTSSPFGSGRIIHGSAAVELVNYVNQGLLRIAELERKSLESYGSVIGENYTTDQRVYEEMKDSVIPLYKRFLDGLRDIDLENEEIKRVHAIYIQGAEMIYDGFKTKMLGIENEDEDIIIQGNQKIEKGREDVKQWRLELLELYKKQGVAEINE